MSHDRKPYPSDVSDEEWSLVVPYLTLMTEDAPQRDYPLRELFNGLRYVIRYGIAWRAMPNDLPPWSAVYQQTHRWLAAGCFETLAQDLRAVLRIAAGRPGDPTAAVIDSRTLQSTPESGARAGYDGAKRKNGSKVHAAVDTLGNLLALTITVANEQERTQVSELAGYDFERSELQIIDIYNFRDGKHLLPTGYLPTFIDRLIARDLLRLEFLYGDPEKTRAART